MSDDFPTPEAPNMATVYCMGKDSSNKISGPPAPRHAEDALLEALEDFLDPPTEQIGEQLSEFEVLMFEWFLMSTLQEKWGILKLHMYLPM